MKAHLDPTLDARFAQAHALLKRHGYEQTFSVMCERSEQRPDNFGAFWAREAAPGRARSRMVLNRLTVDDVIATLEQESPR